MLQYEAEGLLRVSAAWKKIQTVIGFDMVGKLAKESLPMTCVGRDRQGRGDKIDFAGQEFGTEPPTEREVRELTAEMAVHLERFDEIGAMAMQRACQ